MPGKPSHGPSPRRPTRRSFETFSRDVRFKQDPKLLERISFMANPKEWLVPTSNRKPKDLGELVEEMRQRGLVHVGFSNGKVKVTPTSLARGQHFLTKYCLSSTPFVRLPRSTKFALARLYIVILIRQHDFNSATQKYDSVKPINQKDILDRMRMDTDIMGLNRRFHAFGDPKSWDSLTKQYYHFLSQRAAIALAAEEYLNEKRWKIFMGLRSAKRLVRELPKLAWGKKMAPD